MHRWECARFFAATSRSGAATVRLLGNHRRQQETGVLGEEIVRVWSGHTQITFWGWEHDRQRMTNEEWPLLSKKGATDGWDAGPQNFHSHTFSQQRTREASESSWKLSRRSRRNVFEILWFYLTFPSGEEPIESFFKGSQNRLGESSVYHNRVDQSDLSLLV